MSQQPNERLNAPVSLGLANYSSETKASDGAAALRKQITAFCVFAIAAVFMAFTVPTVEIAWVVAILLLTIYLFAFELVGVDVAAVTIMVLLGLTSLCGAGDGA